DVLLCVQTGKTVDEENRMRFPTSEFYLKSYDEMMDLFGYVREAIDNTVLIGERCNVDIDFDTLHLPRYEVPEGYTDVEYLKKLCIDGLNERYDEITKEIED